MRPFIGLLFLGFVTLLSVLNFVELKDFCDAFEANGYTISYGFQRIEKFKNSTLFSEYIFIGNNYWKLSLINEEMEVRFMSINSKIADNWFGNNYSMALCLERNVKNWTTYLLHKFDEYWEYGVLDDDPNQLKISGQTQRIDVTNRKPLKNETIGFVAPIFTYGYNTIVLFYQSAGDYEVFKVNTTSVDPIHEKTEITTEYEALKNLSKNVETVAIFGHFSYKRKPGPKLIIVFKVNKTLKYCWTAIKTLSENCRPENHNLLINCSEETDTQLLTDIVIILIVLVIIAFLITVFIAIIALIREKPKKEEPLRGLESPKNKDMYFERLKKSTKEEEPKEVTHKKSETFETESDVDYSKPIPLESSESSADTTESDTKRPTDLEKQKN